MRDGVFWSFACTQGIEQCTHLFVIFWLHLADRSRLDGYSSPSMAKSTVSLPTRSPNRPDPLALDVELQEIKGNRLTVRGMDALDGSLLLDIKPYSRDSTLFPQARIAWQKDGGRKGD